LAFPFNLPPFDTVNNNDLTNYHFIEQAPCQVLKTAVFSGFRGFQQIAVYSGMKCFSGRAASESAEKLFDPFDFNVFRSPIQS
jgi:hypothetical protein